MIRRIAVDLAYDLPIAILALAVVLALSACTSQQRDQIVTACDAAMKVASVASIVPQAAPVAMYVTAGCGTAEGIAKLAADPSSQEWLAQQRAKIQAIAAGAGVRL